MNISFDNPRILMKRVKQYLKTKPGEVTKHHPDREYIKTGIDPDHLDLQMIIPPE